MVSLLTHFLPAATGLSVTSRRHGGVRTGTAPFIPWDAVCVQDFLPSGSTALGAAGRPRINEAKGTEGLLFSAIHLPTALLIAFLRKIRAMQRPFVALGFWKLAAYPSLRLSGFFCAACISEVLLAWIRR